MVTWAEFAAAAPELAERGFRQLSIPVAYLATVRKDGAPRLHPLSPMFADGRLFVAIQSTSPRRRSIARRSAGGRPMGQWTGERTSG